MPENGFTAVYTRFSWPNITKLYVVALQGYLLKGKICSCAEVPHTVRLTAAAYSFGVNPMKKALIALACTALATPLVFAQAKNFEGLSLSASLANTKTTFDDSTNAVSYDGTSTGVDFNAQYNWALGQEFVLGVGLTMGTGNNKAGTTAAGNDITTKNRYALEFTPGFAVSKDLLVYGKIASIGGTADVSGVGSESGTGVGYGLGVRGMLDKNMFWQVGYDLNQYAEKSSGTLGTYKAKSSVFSLGVGYKF